MPNENENKDGEGIAATLAAGGITGAIAWAKSQGMTRQEFLGVAAAAWDRYEATKERVGGLWNQIVQGLGSMGDPKR